MADLTPAVVKTRTSLAYALGKAPNTVHSWRYRGDWPFGDGPYEVAKVREWAAKTLKADPAKRYNDAIRGRGDTPLSELDKAKIANLRAMARIHNQKLRKLKGEVHNVADCEARHVRQLVALRNQFVETSPRALALELVGCERADIERIIRERNTAILNAFARGQE